jgi:hypothetical protein
MAEFTVDTIELDLPAVAGALSRRLHDAGVPTSAERAVRFAQSLELVRPISRRRASRIRLRRVARAGV